MKKKVLAIVLCVAMLAVAIVGGTMAYFTDTDAATNTMTVGSVAIDQVEQERGENGALQSFNQNKPVVPAVYGNGTGKLSWGEAITVGGGSQKVFADDIANVIDKFVFVQNTGKSDAYVRTIIAIEAPGFDAKDLIHVNVNDSVGVTMSAWTPVTIGGVEYVYAVFTYTEALEPAAMTPVSLAQVFLDPATTNEDVAAYGAEWTILALSQAVQADGIDDAATALDVAFEEATATNVADWFRAANN